MLVVDASVAVKWFVEEPDTPPARALLREHHSGAEPLVAPHLLVYEVANALLHNAAFTPLETRRCIRHLYDLEIEWVVPPAALVDAAIALASHLRASFYDALYVRLAVHLNAPLVTADTRLLTKLRGHSVRLRHLQDRPG